MKNTNTNKVWIVDATEPEGGSYGSSMSYPMSAYWSEDEAREEARRLTANEQWSKDPLEVIYSVHSMEVQGVRPS